MKTTKSNVKTILVSRRARKIKEIEERIETLNASMDYFAKQIADVSDMTGTDRNRFERAFREASNEFWSDEMDRIYRQIEKLRSEIDALEVKVIEIRFRF